MSVNIGSATINKSYLGSVETNKLYLGSTLVYDNAGFDFTTDLVASWQFESNLLDFTSNNHDATAGGTVTTNTAGKVNNGADFGGDADYLTVPNNSDFSFTDGTSDLPFTIALWVKFDAFRSDGAWLINKRGGGDNKEWQISYYLGELRLQLFHTGTSPQIRIDYTITLSTSTWYQVVVTYDGSETASGIKMYLDGVSVGTTSTSGTYTGMTAGNSDVWIGVRAWAYNLGELDGKLDEVKVYKNREFTQAEVTDMYTKEAAGNSVL